MIFCIENLKLGRYAPTPTGKNFKSIASTVWWREPQWRLLDDQSICIRCHPLPRALGGMAWKANGYYYGCHSSNSIQPSARTGLMSPIPKSWCWIIYNTKCLQYRNMSFSQVWLSTWMMNAKRYWSRWQITSRLTIPTMLVELNTFESWLGKLPCVGSLQKGLNFFCWTWLEFKGVLWSWETLRFTPSTPCGWPSTASIDKVPSWKGIPWTGFRPNAASMIILWYLDRLQQCQLPPPKSQSHRSQVGQATLHCAALGDGRSKARSAWQCSFEGGFGP